MQHLVIEFQHRIEDVIPYCEFIKMLRPQLEKGGFGSYVGDDMAIDGGDAEATFVGGDARKLFNFVAPQLETLPFMSGAKITLVFGPLESGAEECTFNLNKLP